jgi:D-aminopeptidase
MRFISGALHKLLNWIGLEYGRYLLEVPKGVASDEEAQRLIREGTARAIRRRGEIKPVPASLPVRFDVSFTDPSLALMAEQIPTVERAGPHGVAFAADDYLAGYRFVRVLYKFIQ